MTITISQKLIDEGVRKDCENCPAAKAIEEATGAPADVSHECILWGPSSNIEERGFCYQYATKTPPAVSEFMDRFDGGLPVETISFELEAAYHPGVPMTAWNYYDLAGELIAQGIRPDFIDGKAIDFSAPTVEAAAASVELDAWFHDHEQEDEEWQDEELHRLLTEH